MQICSRLIMPCIRDAFGQQTACNNQLRTLQYRYYLLLRYHGCVPLQKAEWFRTTLLFPLSIFASIENCSHYLPETFLINLDGTVCFAITGIMFLEVLCMVMLFSA